MDEEFAKRSMEKGVIKFKMMGLRSTLFTNSNELLL